MAVYSPNGLAGKWMRFQVLNSVTYTNVKITRCRSNLRTMWPETTNSESGPLASAGAVVEEFVAGVSGGDVDIDIIYRTADLTYSILANGSSYEVWIIPDKGQTGSTTSPPTGHMIYGTLSVETFEFTGEVKGLFTARVSGKFNGGYTVTTL